MTMQRLSPEEVAKSREKLLAEVRVWLESNGSDEAKRRASWLANVLRMVMREQPCAPQPAKEAT